MDVALFSQLVRMARTALKWTIRDLAEEAGVSPDTIMRVEKGDPLVKHPSWVAVQGALENAGVELIENGTVLLHSSLREAGVAGSPDMPLGVRRIYPEKSLAYVVTTSDQGTFKIFYDSGEARKEILQFLGRGYESLDSNLSKTDGLPKYFKYKRKDGIDTATITYLRYDLPEGLKVFLENEAIPKDVEEEQQKSKEKIKRLFEAMHTSLASAARAMGITREALNSCLYSDCAVANETAQRLSVALKGYHQESFQEDILNIALRLDLQKTEKCSPELAERIQSYFENLRKHHQNTRNQ